MVKTLAGGGGAISDEEEKKLNENSCQVSCYSGVYSRIWNDRIRSSSLYQYESVNQSGLKRPIQRLEKLFVPYHFLQSVITKNYRCCDRGLQCIFLY